MTSLVLCAHIARFKVYGKPLGASASVPMNNTSTLASRRLKSACVTGTATSDPVIPGGGGMASSKAQANRPRRKWLVVCHLELQVQRPH